MTSSDKLQEWYASDKYKKMQQELANKEKPKLNRHQRRAAQKKAKENQ